MGRADQSVQAAGWPPAMEAALPSVQLLSVMLDPRPPRLSRLIEVDLQQVVQKLHSGGVIVDGAEVTLEFGQLFVELNRERSTDSGHCQLGRIPQPFGGDAKPMQVGRGFQRPGQFFRETLALRLPLSAGVLS